MESYEPEGYTVIPPSPEVSALMQYVDFPVSRFTGQPDITLPLYTFREGSLELPITISYHGVRVWHCVLPDQSGYGTCTIPASGLSFGEYIVAVCIGPEVFPFKILKK